MIKIQMIRIITSQVWLGASMQGCHSQEVEEPELFKITKRTSKVINMKTRARLGWNGRMKKCLLNNVLKAAAKNQSSLKKEDALISTEWDLMLQVIMMINNSFK